jgi:hypothetical protein
MSTTILGLHNTAVRNQKISSEEWNKIANAVEFAHIQIAEAFGAGFLSATDFNVSANGTSKTVPVSAGRAFVGASGERMAVYADDIQNVLLVGTTASPQTNYGYVNQDGTITVVQNPMSAPANSVLAWSCTCTDAGASAINNLPDGRVNLLSVNAVLVSATDKQAKLLEDALVEGTNITITKIGDGENEQLEISATGGGGGGLSAPVADGDLAEEYINSDGTRAMGANFDVGGNRVINMNYPTGALHAVNLTYLQTYYLPLVGGTITGPIVCATVPTVGTHLTNKTYVDGLFGSYYKIDGTYALTGDMDAGGNRLKEVGDPEDDADAVNLAWIKSGVGQPVLFAADARGTFDSSDLLSAFSCSQPTIWGGSMTAAKSSARSKIQATASAVCKIFKNVLGTGRTEIGTITFSSGSYAGVISFPSPVTLAQHELIEINAPASADATLGDLVITLAGELA